MSNLKGFNGEAVELIPKYRNQKKSPVKMFGSFMEKEKSREVFKSTNKERLLEKIFDYESSVTEVEAEEAIVSDRVFYGECTHRLLDSEKVIDEFPLGFSGLDFVGEKKIGLLGYSSNFNRPFFEKDLYISEAQLTDEYLISLKIIAGDKGWYNRLESGSRVLVRDAKSDAVYKKIIKSFNLYESVVTLRESDNARSLDGRVLETKVYDRFTENTKYDNLVHGDLAQDVVIVANTKMKKDRKVGVGHVPYVDWDREQIGLKQILVIGAYGDIGSVVERVQILHDAEAVVIARKY